MPLDIWRSGREQTVVGSGHKRVRVGVGKAEQESSCLGWSGRSEQGKQQPRSRPALSVTNTGVKINDSCHNNSNSTILLKTNYPKVWCRFNDFLRFPNSHPRYGTSNAFWKRKVIKYIKSWIMVCILENFSKVVMMTTNHFKMYREPDGLTEGERSTDGLICMW